jgi:hypothetical protein
MIDSAARVLAWPRTVDAGRRTRDRDSGEATGRFSGWRSGAAGRAQAGAGVVESVIHDWASVTDRTVPQGIPGDDVRVMLRRLSLPEHGALELVVGLALIAAPFALGFGPAGLLVSMTAGAVVAGIGLSDGLAISAHMAADTAVSLSLLLVAVALASGGEAAAGGVLAVAAACELALGAATRWTRRA